jgi:hypothetical protein
MEPLDSAIICFAINQFSEKAEAGHPIAHPGNIKFFTKEYKLECIAKLKAAIDQINIP